LFLKHEHDCERKNKLILIVSGLTTASSPHGLGGTNEEAPNRYYIFPEVGFLFLSGKPNQTPVTSGRKNPALSMPQLRMGVAGGCGQVGREHVEATPD